MSKLLPVRLGFNPEVTFCFLPHYPRQLLLAQSKRRVTLYIYLHRLHADVCIVNIASCRARLAEMLSRLFILFTFAAPVAEVRAWTPPQRSVRNQSLHMKLNIN